MDCIFEECHDIGEFFIARKDGVLFLQCLEYREHIEIIILLITKLAVIYAEYSMFLYISYFVVSKNRNIGVLNYIIIYHQE
jgi:hypothetical protein